MASYICAYRYISPLHAIAIVYIERPQQQFLYYRRELCLCSGHPHTVSNSHPPRDQTNAICNVSLDLPPSTIAIQLNIAHISPSNLCYNIIPSCVAAAEYCNIATYIAPQRLILKYRMICLRVAATDHHI